MTEEELFEIDRKAHIAVVEVHKRSLLRAQYLLCEGQKAWDWAKERAPPGRKCQQR